MTTTAPIPTEREDPMPAPMLGMWLFLAGEAMFFAGLLTAYIVLQSVPGERALFLRSARVVSLPLTIAAIGVLLASLVAVRWRKKPRVIAGLALLFLVVQAFSCELLMTHRTVVTSTAVFDGRSTWFSAYRGVRAPLPVAIDLAQLMPGDLKGAVTLRGDSEGGPAGHDDIRADVGYGPSRNNYFACYFLVTAAHAIHVLGGLVAMAWVASRRGFTTDVHRQAVSLYWQFVNGIGVLSLVLLALG